MNEDHLYFLDAAKYLHRLPVRHRVDSSQKAATDSPKPKGQAKKPEDKKRDAGQPK